MGLITEEIEVLVSGNNIKWYEEKGYFILKEPDKQGRIRVPKNTKLLVKVRDLKVNSTTRIMVKCDNCGLEMNRTYSDYNKYLKEDGKYYCNKCATKLFSTGKAQKTKLKKTKSFEEWCYDNLSKEEANEIMLRWDIDKNKVLPSEVSFSTGKNYYLKCLKHTNHESELKNINGFITLMRKNNTTDILNCNQCGSFEQWCIDNNLKDILFRWDYSMNTDIKPNMLRYSAHKKVWIKCEKGVHKSELKNVNSFTTHVNKNGKSIIMDCKQCNSIAQWGIDNICPDFLEKYWDYEKNSKLGLEPWNIAKSANKKVWIKCQEKEYHGSYLVYSSSFTRGGRCSYCGNFKVHPKDSLGQYLEDNNSLHLWSDKNKKTSYEFAPFSTQVAWWKCHNNEHKDYQRTISVGTKLELRCPQCDFSKGETLINNYLIQNKIVNTPQKTYEGLLGLGGGLLSYDFYLPSYNLLVEYQGEYHDGNLTGNNKTFFNLEKQQEHDRRKRGYAEKNNINLLEIWYWDYDNIEEILTKTLSELSGETRE